MDGRRELCSSYNKPKTRKHMLCFAFAREQFSRDKEDVCLAKLRTETYACKCKYIPPVPLNRAEQGYGGRMEGTLPEISNSEMCVCSGFLFSLFISKSWSGMTRMLCSVLFHCFIPFPSFSLHWLGCYNSISNK